MNEIEELKSKVASLEARLAKFDLPANFFFQKNFRFLDGFNDFRKIVVGKNKGLTIGSSTTEKLSLYGVTPVVQASAISAPSGGLTVDAEARTAINSIRTALTSLGITA